LREISAVILEKVWNLLDVTFCPSGRVRISSINADKRQALSVIYFSISSVDGSDLLDGVFGMELDAELGCGWVEYFL
jgi:hypothetical protein